MGTEGGPTRYYTLALLLFSLMHSGCTHDIWSFQPAPYRPQVIQEYERLKRELLQMEDLTIGTGPIAAAGRKVTAEITVRNKDGTLAYEGPIVSYWSMIGDGFIANSWQKRGLLSLQQTGIVLGLNGMAVGGKRRITVAPNLACYSGGRKSSLDEGANPRGTCLLAQTRVRGKDSPKVRKLPLIVDATLTAACRPVFLHLGPFPLPTLCLDSDVPRREPDDPIWHFYVVEVAPSKP